MLSFLSLCIIPDLFNISSFTTQPFLNSWYGIQTLQTGNSITVDQNLSELVNNITDQEGVVCKFCILSYHGCIFQGTKLYIQLYDIFSWHKNALCLFILHFCAHAVPMMEGLEEWYNQKVVGTSQGVGISCKLSCFFLTVFSTWSLVTHICSNCRVMVETVKIQFSQPIWVIWFQYSHNSSNLAGVLPSWNKAGDSDATLCSLSWSWTQFDSLWN